MQQQESKVNRPVAGDKELSRKDEIESFFNSHVTNSQVHDVSVKEMRHYIPLFLMEVYSDKYGLYTKKVKGLWEKCPDDWRPGVPFVDPNNKVKSDDGKNCKPKKDPLNQMLKYLIERYQNKQKNESGNFLQAQMSFNLLETDDASVGPSARPSACSLDQLDQHSMYSSSLRMDSGSYCSANQASSRSVLDSGNIDSGNIGELEFNSFFLELNQEFPGIFGGELINQPEQAVDNEDVGMGGDWDPVGELKQRISQKLHFIKKQKLVNASDFQSLEARYNSLKEAVMDEALAIEKLHLLEKDIDKLRFSKRSSNERFYETPLHNSNQFSKKPELKDETVFKCSDIDVCTDLPVEVPVAVQDPSLMSSLNIKSRLGGSQPTGTIGHLQLRSGPGPSSEAQNAGCLKSSASSKYCNPVQQPEDDNLMEPGQNTLELLFPSLDNSVHFEEQMSELQLTEDTEENRFMTPVQETGVAYMAASVANKMDTVPEFIGASALSLHSMCLGNDNVESAASLPPILNLENLENSAQKLFQYLMQQSDSSLALPQPSMESPMVTVPSLMVMSQPPMRTAKPPMFTAQSPMVTAQSPMVTAQSPMVAAQSPMVTAQSPMVPAQPSPFPVFQPQATYNRSQIQTPGKRVYPFDDEDDVEMVAAPNQSTPSPEASFGSLIPTTVEEMSDIISVPSSKNRKARRTTWKDQA